MKRSRPGKAKAKQAAQVEQLTGSEALRIKQIIDAGRQPDEDTLLRLLNSGTQCESLYAKACKGKSGNPNCLCNLVPAPGSYRKAGLWAKQPEALAQLGPDPAAVKREKPDQPVGLRNLGNTCYVNSVLQCLFANHAFRHAVYAARPPVADHKAVKELRQLFVELEAGATSPVDPGPLVGALELDHGVQQDGQEFMKLLLTLLEHQFARQVDIKDAIPTLFRGQSGYETVCQACGRPSDSSSRSSAFYELDVPVKGFKSLQESLGSLLAPEFLCGNNQYSCDFCRAKVDASRQLRLRDLPPMLCLSLQRFVFDFNKMDRVKATDKFAFPLELDMGPYLGLPAPLPYDLVAILIHKGGSAMHGHYVAHINLGGVDGAEGPIAAGGWWRFDDEGVARMKAGPCSSADHGGAGPAAKKAAGTTEEGPGGGRGQKKGGGRGGGGAGRGRGRGRGRPSASAPKQGARQGASGKAAVAAAVVSLLEEDGEEMEVSEMSGPDAAGEDELNLNPKLEENGVASEGTGGKAQAQAVAEIVSQNAYLLVYRQRCAELAAVQLDKPTQQWLAEARARLQAEYEQRCTTYASAKGDVGTRTQQRQEEVRAVVEAAVALPEGDPGCYVSASWLQSWADADGSAGIDPIDNSPLLCPHGKLDPAKTQDMKRISTPAWEQLCSSYKGGPQLQLADACPTCLADKLAAVAASEDSQEQRDQYLALASALLENEGGGEDSAEFYVSKTWLSAWHKRSGRSMSGASPTAAITCPHGQLAPEQFGKQAKRVGVPSNFWGFLKRCWDAAVAERQRKQQQQQRGKQAGAAAAQDEVVTIDSDGDVAVQDAGPPAPAGAVSTGGTPQASGACASDEVVEVVGADAELAAGAAQAQAPAGQQEAGTGGGGGEGAGSVGGDPLREFRWDCEECATCQVDLNAAAELAQGLRGRREAEKAVLAHLVSAPPIMQPLPGFAYNLVPTAFMEHWRAYMAQAGRRAGTATMPGAVAQPPCLAEYMAGLMCECHTRGERRLAYPPPAMINKRGRWVVAEHEDGGGNAGASAAAEASGGGVQRADSVWQLLNSEDWQALGEVYGEGDALLQRGVTATLHVATDCATDAAPPSADEMAAPAPGASSADDEEDAASRLDADYEVEIGENYLIKRKRANRGGKRAWLEASPGVCGATVAARREAAKANALCYQGAEVMVEVVGSEEEALAKPTQAPGGERKSKRARKGRAPLHVDSTHTLGALKLRIFESVDVHPLNARLYVRGSMLTREDGATLAECEIYPGEDIKVVDTREHDSIDYAAIVALYGGDVAGKKGRRRETERGFTGTALAGLHMPLDPADLEEGGGAGLPSSEQRASGEGGVDAAVQG